MTLIEAIKSGKPFRLARWVDGRDYLIVNDEGEITWDDGQSHKLNKSEIIAETWQIKEEERPKRKAYITESGAVMGWFVDKCPEYCEMRFLHGLVDRKYSTNYSITMLVPFHLIARFALTLWHAFIAPPLLWWERRR